MISIILCFTRAGWDGTVRDGTGRDGLGRDRRLSFIRYRLDSIGTGTTSDADWACQGYEKNVQFFQIVEGKVPAWIHPERL